MFLATLVLLAVAIMLTAGPQPYASASAVDGPPSTTEPASLFPEFDPTQVFANSCSMPMGPDPTADSMTTSKSLGGDLAPARSVTDPYPSFNGVVVDPVNNVALFSDANRKSVMIYDRTAGGKLATQDRPLKQIMGPDSLGGFYAGLLADPERREVYAVNNDIEDNMAVFSYDDNGNVKPKRVLGVPHGAWGMAMSKARDEIAFTIQDVSANAVVFFRREAKNLEAPLRIVQGKKTELADPHGIYVDDARNELIVANWGSWNVPLGSWSAPMPKPPSDLPGGEFNDPSINFYPATAQGEVAPLRKIQGEATQLNWPTGIDVDPVSNQIVVANNGDNSILIFPRDGSGNLKPTRIIKGARTGINRPMGVSIDRKNSELWVANFGAHTAVIFDLNATGNAEPKRVLRNAPAGSPTGGFGNPMGIGYDSKREEVLVAN
jgi:DNA-binding beta-propeller fold protein YncE